MNPMFLLPLLLAGVAVEPAPQARPRRLRGEGDPSPGLDEAWAKHERERLARMEAAARAEEERVTLAKSRAQAKRERKAARQRVRCQP